MSRIILHIDLDSFFASVEERENPHFRGRPIVVGADPKEGRGRGVVSTANYKARKFGIHSAMPISKAYRLCPQCVFLPVDMPLYTRASERVMAIVKKYIPRIEVVSIDEAYGDLSGARSYRKAEDIGHAIRRDIFREEKLTATIGIGPNKMIAKLAANSAKPNGLRVVRPSGVRAFLDPLDVREIPGVGPKGQAALYNLGVRTVRELRSVSENFLAREFGKWGRSLFLRARGIADDEIVEEEEIKSIGHEETFERDTRDPDLIFALFDNVLRKTYEEAEAKRFAFRTISIKCRFTGFETRTKDKTFGLNARRDHGVAEWKMPIPFFQYKRTAHHLLLQMLLANKKPVRLLGVRVS